METSASSLISGYAANAAQAVTRPDASRASATEAASPARESGKDSVSISDTARQFGKLMAKGRGEVVEDESESQDPVEKLQKKIEELEKKIAQVEESSVPEATKQGVTKGLETQLAALRQQLAALMSQTAKAGGGKGKA